MKLLTLMVLAALLFPGCRNEERQTGAGPSIVVFIPGVMAGSAVYQMLAEGALKAVEEFNRGINAGGSDGEATITVIEGGFNQAAWENQITTLAASGEFDLIISSNPSMPDLLVPVLQRFPSQKFLLLDAEMAGNPNVFSLRYNQREQGFMAGYIAALVSLELSGPGGGARRLGLIAGQEYPMMNNVILPGFIEGAQAVDPDFTVDFRVVGNWFDAARAAELAAAMIRGGVNVLLPIAGGAGHGVVQAAEEAGAKIVWFNTNGYAIRPGTIVGSSILRQDLAAYQTVTAFLNGTLPFGQAEVAGAVDGFVDFVEDDPYFIAAVSPEIRARQAILTARIRSGELRLD